MKISNLIDEYLGKNNKDYFPYLYSLKDKIKIASHIKKIINKNCDFRGAGEKTIKNAVGDLSVNGYYKFDNNFFPKKSIKKILQHLKNTPAYPSHIAYYDKHHPISDPFDSDLPILSYSIDELFKSKELLDIVLSKEIIDTCKEYLGAPPVLFDLNAVITNGKSWKHHETHDLHRDHDDFHHVLLMLYLTDVDDNNGPHTYLKKSHSLVNKSSKIKPLLSSNNQVKDLYDESDKFEEVRMIGKSGTAFLTDANGLHSGRSPTPGNQRIIIWARYGLGKNYMWNVHNHQWWNYEKKYISGYKYERILELFMSKNNNKKNILNDPPMRCTTFYRWNIVVWGQNYYAIPHALGPFSIDSNINVDDDFKSIKKIMGKKDIIVNQVYSDLLQDLSKKYNKTKIKENFKEILNKIFKK